MDLDAPRLSSNQKTYIMIKIILTFGIVAGAICGSMFYLTHSDTPDFESGMWIGYLTMIIALSTIFFATRQYRDKYNNGSINFGKAFQVGIGITLVAALVYVIIWEIYYTNFASDFTDQYLTYMRDGLADQGKTAAEIDSEIAPTVEMMANYKDNMLMRMGMTAMEIVPVGLIITLISSVVFGKLIKK